MNYRTCEKCGGTYDAWDGHCDCERSEQYDIQKRQPGGTERIGASEIGRGFDRECAAV